MTSRTKPGSWLGLHYAVRLASAHLVAAFEVIAVLVPLHGKVVPSLAPLLICIQRPDPHGRGVNGSPRCGNRWCGELAVVAELVP
jgi:hypothetical protein